jgi:hypothetical protein
MWFECTLHTFLSQFVATNVDLSVSFQSAEPGGECGDYGRVECGIL